MKIQILLIIRKLFFPKFDNYSECLKIGENNLKALHVIHIESSINIEESIFEVDDDEFEFELQVLKEDFEWDLSIAKSKEVPFQLVINEDLKNRLIESTVKK